MRYQRDCYDDDSPCNRCGATDADCDCAREFDTVNDLLSLGNGGIILVVDIDLLDATREGKDRRFQY